MGRSRGWPTSATEATEPAAAIRPMSTVGVAVQRLTQERVLELAKEIWTASGADGEQQTKTTLSCQRLPAWETRLTSTSSKPSSRVLTRTPSSAA